MRIAVALLFIVAAGMIVFSGSNTESNVWAQEGRKPKDEYISAPMRSWAVKFSHIEHVTKNRFAEPVTMDNQQAFHRNCNSCHDEVVKGGRASTGPTSKKCTACHKKTAG